MTLLRWGLLLTASLMFSALCAQKPVKLKCRDRRKDVELITTEGTIFLRLYDSTPLHRDNFLRLVKSGYYNGLLFHRVIAHFVIQGGDPQSRNTKPGLPLGNGDTTYTVPAEFCTSVFHKRGAIGAARESDEVNPLKASSGTQFYIVQGKTFSDAGLDSVEQKRLGGRRIPEQHRRIYETLGGTPQLDLNYTVFGEVIKGMDVVDRIAAVPTSHGADRDRPLQDVMIIRAKLVRRTKQGLL